MSKRCADWTIPALGAIIAAATVVVGGDAARAGPREQAVIAVLKYARDLGVAVGAGVGGNYVYDKLHGSKAEASPAPKIDDTRMRELIRGMLADQRRLDAANPQGFGSFANPGTIDFLRSCNESPACSPGLYRQIQTTR